jgi:hypothetical protein
MDRYIGLDAHASTCAVAVGSKNPIVGEITGVPRENPIRRISSGHPEWGEDRIASELRARLGVEHASSTIRRYMATRKGNDDPTSTTWQTFLTGHASELWTMDLTTQPLWNYSAFDRRGCPAVCDS